MVETTFERFSMEYPVRCQYLWDLAEDYGVDPAKVFSLAYLLGESEDFDGLVSAVNELSDMGE